MQWTRGSRCAFAWRKAVMIGSRKIMSYSRMHPVTDGRRTRLIHGCAVDLGLSEGIDRIDLAQA
jgi:hypothetical protein